ncbi:DUF4349 domain-containing protein [Actinokineospora diospyrosa]|uniref:DUF4349 domain-containing protein n=1 Tax=Actinokineospora diospyrosa TaxID=103728 RepID=A0ABT1IHR1_9PSEU|nr:DUF4349 domain-containing protein [Actinokineospora diospyrosa]MCP2272182.1 protein of unknown function (DUF4349) [Actinokineospora diospyrosa]
MVLNKTRLVGLVLLAAGAFTAGCTSTGTSSGASAPVPAMDRGAAGDSFTGAESGSAPGSGSKAEAAPQAPEQARVDQPGVDRKLVRTASVELSAPKVPEAADRVRAEAVAAGGFSGQEQVTDRFATLTVHVPSDKLDAALSRIAEAGTVTSRSQTAQDVTEQVVDVESRIQTQRTSLARVRALLDRATSISEIVQLESEVTRREAELESLLKRREALAGSVALSAVTVRISVDGAAPVPVSEDDSFLGALATGWHAFLDAGSFVLRVVGTLLPFAVVLGVPAYLIWRYRRRNRSVAPPAVAAQVVPES